MLRQGHQVLPNLSDVLLGHETELWHVSLFRVRASERGLPNIFDCVWAILTLRYVKWSSKKSSSMSEGRSRLGLLRKDLFCNDDVVFFDDQIVVYGCYLHIYDQFAHTCEPLPSDQWLDGKVWQKWRTVRPDTSYWSFSTTTRKQGTLYSPPPGHEKIVACWLHPDLPEDTSRATDELQVRNDSWPPLNYLLIPIHVSESW